MTLAYHDRVNLGLRAARNLARKHRTDGDVDAATRTLAAAAQALLDDPGTRAFAWRMLAAAWWELGDRDTAHHYLEHGRACATTVEELCDLACGYHAIGGRDAAAALVSRAETMAGEWTMIAFTCEYELGDPERARACIDRGLRDPTDLDDALALVKRLPHDDQTIRDHLARISSLAVTSEDYIEIAGICHVVVFDLESADPYLDRAAALATDERTRHQIAYRRMHWSMGAESIDADPELFPSEILRGAGRRAPGWERDPSHLFDVLRSKIDRATLADIAENEPWEGYDATADAILVSFGATGRIPHPLSFQPRNELEVERYGRGPDHLRRAFACAILCIDVAGPSPGDSDGGNDETSIPALLESCIALGPDAVDGALGLFVAMADAYPKVDQNYKLLFAELGMVLAAAWRDPSDPRLAPVITRLIADGHRVAAAQKKPRKRGDQRWLLGLTLFDMQHDLWRSLAKTILAHSIPHLAELAALLR